MRAFRWFGLVIFVACGGGTSKLDPDAMTASDAAIVTDVFDETACMVPPDRIDCAVSCGNGQLDMCWIAGRDSFGRCRLSSRTETCEGVVTCADSGYYGTTNICSTSCLLSVNSCEACNPSNPDCAIVGDFRFSEMAASGSRLGLIEDGGTTGPNPRIWIVEGLLEVADAQPTGSRVQAIVGSGNGWLVATNATVFTVSSSGALGTAFPIDVNATNVTSQALANAGQRSIVAWTEHSGSWNAVFQIVGMNGQSVVAKTTLFASDGDTPGVGSDGTSFFVGSLGSLARVSTNGTFLVTAGFPMGNRVRITWSGTTGWYIADSASGYVAQRFDSNGALVGSAITIGPAEDFLADGADLLVLRYASTKLNLLRIDASGAVLGTIEVGAGGAPGVYGGGVARLARVGVSLYVAWLWFQLRIAKIASP